MDNSLLAVRDINHKYIVVERSDSNRYEKNLQHTPSGMHRQDKAD